MTFCNPFDEALAYAGPAAVFLPDREGLMRFEPTWTRDAYNRLPGPHEHGHTWVLVRDHRTGFVTLLLATSPTLVPEWPQADVRHFATREEATAARAALGTPPVVREGW